MTRARLVVLGVVGLVVAGVVAGAAAALALGVLLPPRLVAVVAAISLVGLPVAAYAWFAIGFGYGEEGNCFFGWGAARNDAWGAGYALGAAWLAVAASLRPPHEHPD
jgi:hypothetical protein